MKGFILLLASLLFAADAFSVLSPPPARARRLADKRHAHPAAVDVDSMCMMNLAEYCASDSEFCDVEDQEALAEWMQERKHELQRQADEMTILSQRLVTATTAAAPQRITASAPSPSRRDVRSLMNSISACLSLEEVGSFA
jgi:hypothetical protein